MLLSADYPARVTLIWICSNTSQYCDPQLLAWSAQRCLNSSQSCLDCWLGVQALQLSNPLGYDSGLATNFASLTSSCNATSGYAFTSPTVCAFNSAATTVPTSVRLHPRLRAQDPIPSKLRPTATPWPRPLMSRPITCCTTTTSISTVRTLPPRSTEVYVFHLLATYTLGKLSTPVQALFRAIPACLSHSS